MAEPLIILVKYDDLLSHINLNTDHVSSTIPSVAPLRGREHAQRAIPCTKHNVASIVIVVQIDVVVCNPLLSRQLTFTVLSGHLEG